MAPCYTSTISLLSEPLLRELLGWVEARDEGSVRTQTALAQLGPSTSSGVYILASYLFSMISFFSLGLRDNLPLLLPNGASRSSLTLFLHFSEGIRRSSQSFCSHFEKGKDTKGSSWLFNYQKQMIFPLIMFCPRRIQDLALLLCLIGLNTCVQYCGHYLK